MREKDTFVLRVRRYWSICKDAVLRGVDLGKVWDAGVRRAWSARLWVAFGSGRGERGKRGGRLPEEVRKRERIKV